MRIGIFPELNRLSGGVFQYGLTMLHALRGLKSSDDEYVIFAHEGFDGEAFASLEAGAAWRVESVVPPSLRRQTFFVLSRALGETRSREAVQWLRGQMQRASSRGKATIDPDVVRRCPEVARWLRRCGVELMLYPAANPLSFETGMPSVVAVHDLQHRLQPEFPEVSADGVWEQREYLYRNLARHATLLLTDSETGREDVLNFYAEYGATPERVKVLPFLPAHYLTSDIAEDERQRVRATHHLPERYLFYPAQFWPHKNHARLVRALGLLKQQGINVSIVLVGSHAGEIREATFQDVESLAHEQGVAEHVHYLGYVPDEDMSALYAEAVALVMPTFFGPTNIPVLEAWAFDCPVLTSDIRGIREQAGDAALLVNPRSVEELAEGIRRLWTDENLRQTLTAQGRRRLATYSYRDYCRRLGEIIEEAKALVHLEERRSTAS
ncbi:MAG TPA: glycosyltransferase family 1 protein [Pyrinomonadaceae bacterium]|jgi:glycosyltransferase involved in cell wall biosynthesis